MCNDERASQVEQRALCHFRFFVYREYREIRHLGGKGSYDKFADQSARCRELAKADKGKKWFADRYHEVGGQADVAAIVGPFEHATDLTLEQVHEALSKGQWHDGYGGSRHAAMVALAIALRHGIEDARRRGDWTNADAVVDALRKMEHNSRRAIEDFKDLKVQGPCCILPPD